MRGALSSLLNWLRRLGDRLLLLLSAILLTSLQNQHERRYGKTGDPTFGDPSSRHATSRVQNRLWYRCPTRGRRVSCKRKRQLCEDYQSTRDRLSSFTSPAKKCRLGRTYGWRFWLPSSFDPVGDQSLLSENGKCNNSGSQFMGTNVEMISQDRDFVAEAREVRSLLIRRPRRCTPARSMRLTTALPPGRSSWIIHTGFCGWESNRFWAKCSELFPPGLSGLWDWYQCSRSQLLELVFSAVGIGALEFSISLESCSGRLFTNDQVGTLELRNDLLDAWKIRDQLKVLKTKQGLFEIILPNEEAKKWALSRNPWIIKDRLLVLRSWAPVITKGIFDEMAKAPFRVQRSVWINQQNHHKLSVGKSESQSGPRIRNQASTRAVHHAPSHASLGSVSQEESVSQHGKRVGLSPGRRGSPGGIIINRHPKLRLGNARQNQLGRHKWKGAAGARGAEEMMIPQVESPCDEDVMPTETQGTLLHAETRRRRLLLEADSDDDMIDASPGAVDGVHSNREDETLKGPGQGGAPTAACDDIPIKRKSKPRRPKLPALNQAGERVVSHDDVIMGEAPPILVDAVARPRLGSPPVGAVGSPIPKAGESAPSKRKPRRGKHPLLKPERDGAVHRVAGTDAGSESRGREQPQSGTLRGKRKSKKAGGDGAVVQGVVLKELLPKGDITCTTTMGGDIVQPGCDKDGKLNSPHASKGDSDGSGSEDEALRFVIEKRVPQAVSKKKDSPSKGRVSRVVEAFEAGLTIADKHPAAAAACFELFFATVTDAGADSAYF
ncbi:unnamed protein product [Linum tenue]|uniref:DUF4283 domain-containing protein n=1 Tax=Linum tenue TaxID=586396 RepID=A0AAV0RUI4_9ROSI|nr:unnamed protein product [Linum tenue]